MASDDLKHKVSDWLKWDKNPKTHEQIRLLHEQNDHAELDRLLSNRISFGTAGLRGVMSAGFACMNDLVIIQTGQGFLKFLENTQKELLKKNGIIIGYDGRHNSKRWAELTATIFVNAGYKVGLFSTVNPTPFVSFAVKKYEAASGVMVTASHNPKEDNGYKVYGPNSAQIKSPADKQIQNCILEQLEPKNNSWNCDNIQENSLVYDPLSEVLSSYIDCVDKAIPEELKANNREQNLLFTYTAMHGVGYNFVQAVLDKIGINFIPVEEQKLPDPEFPTVKFPNPEEGKSSLDLSFKTAESNNCSIIIANDPDADRFAAAEKNSSGWKVFTGNELGALLGWWMLELYKKQEVSLKNVFMISSTVSSMILRTMAKAEGFNFIETLTGFKWMGNEALDLMSKNQTVLYCFEESIGYMCGMNVVDKDGVSAAAFFTTMASFLALKGKTVTDQLREIYEKYGYHLTNNSYFICHDKQKIERIFERIRNYSDTPQTYPESILNGKYKVTSVRDLTTGFDSSQKDLKAVLPVSKSSQMITFNFDNGLVCTLRTSGTEPKIKYYTELCASPDIKDLKQVKSILDEMVAAILEEFLQPAENQLQAKAD